MHRAAAEIDQNSAAARRGARAFALAAVPYIAATTVAFPLILIVASLFSARPANLAHVWSTTGPEYLAGALLLAVMVGLGASIVGVIAAGFIAFTEFPGRRFFAVALALPLALPAYISAYAYGDLLGPFGAVERLLAPIGGAPDIKTLPGAAFILTLATYPYVYLAARASFAARSGAFLEAARALGASPPRAILMVLAPAGRAAIAGGLALALMETIADFGVAEYFGVPTLSVGIFRTWRGLGDLSAASQLAAGLFLIAVLLVVIEDAARRGSGADSARAHRAPARLRLSTAMGIAGAAFCALPTVFGFALPVATLVAMLGEGAGVLGARLAAAAANTGLAGAVGAAAAMTVAGCLAASLRGAPAPMRRMAVRIATLGYAFPGAVIAVGVAGAAAMSREAFGFGAAGLALLVYAYVVRFSTAAFNSIDGGLKQIHPSTDDAARVLGAGPARIAARLYWPAARPALLAGLMIVFIDISRELPATLLLRPFGFETLATEVYRLASDERLAEAAPAALALVAIGLAPALLVEWLGRAAAPRPA